MVDWSVYLVTDAERSAGRTTPAVVRAAVDAGVGVVQLRDKDANARDRLAVGRELRRITNRADVPLIVNDRVDLALALDADGVHLGDDDLPVPVARDLLGADAIVGRSVSTVDEARDAVAAGADYLGVGAIYPTDSKPDIDEADFAIGCDRLREIATTVDVPIVGIGGIDPSNAKNVVRAGADGVAVISAITGAEAPAAATRALRDAVESSRDAD